MYFRCVPFGSHGLDVSGSCGRRLLLQKEAAQIDLATNATVDSGVRIVLFN
jgi:hypothetical protein